MAEAPKPLLLELDQVLFNFASTPDEKFQPALTRVLPRVLHALTGCDDAVRESVVLILNHINKRLRVLPTIEIPLSALVTLFIATDVAATLQISFILMYIEKGFSRCSLAPQEKLFLALSLLERLELRPPSQQVTLLHLVLAAMEGKMVFVESLSTKFPFLAGVSGARNLLARFLFDVILYIPNQNFAARKANPEDPPVAIGAPSGLSRTAVNLVTRDGALSSALPRFKSPVCDFIAESGLFTDIEMLQAGLFASCSGDHVTESRGDLLLRKGNVTNLEDPVNISVLLQLFLGDDTAIAPDQRRSPASVLLRPKLGTMFCRSAAAANAMALTLKVAVEMLFGENVSVKLQVIGMQFIRWALRVGTQKTLAKLVPAYGKILLKFLAAPPKDGAATDPLSAQVRGMAYALVGQVGALMPSLYNTNLKLFDQFFTKLGEEGDVGVAASIMEGIAFLRQAYRVAPPGVLDQLKNSLMVFVDHANKNVRLVALQCNNVMFPFHDNTARYMCLRLSNDAVSEIKEEARRGLTTTWYQMQQQKDEDTKMSKEIKEAMKSHGAEGGTVLYPDFAGFMEYIFHQIEKYSVELAPSITSPRHPHIMERVLPFLQESFIQTAKAKQHNEAAYTKYLLESQGSEDQMCVAHYLETIEYAFTLSAGDLQGNASEALLQLVECRPTHFAPYFVSKLAWLQTFLLDGQTVTRETIAKLLCILGGGFSAEVLASFLGRLLIELPKKPHGATLGMGVLVAECLSRNSDGSQQDTLQASLTQCTRSLIEVFETSLASRDFVLTAAAELSLGRIGQAGYLPLPLGNEEKEDKKQEESVAIHVSHGEYTRMDVIKLLAGVASSTRKEARVIEQAIIALAKITIGDRSEAVVTKVTNTLLALATSNVEEMHFAVGQGFAAILTGSSLSEAWSDPVPQRRNPWAEQALESHASDLKTIAQMEEKVFNQIMRVHLPNGSKVQRMAACVWLLCLVKYAPPLIHKRLSDVQAAFSRVLTDSNQFTQECASKGLALLYEVGDPEMQQVLVKSLLQTFSVGIRTVRDDTEVVIDAESGDFTTYKELCQVANEIGQPDLVYKFLDLASHHSIWSSKVGAAFSLGSIVAANRQLAPHLSFLLPKIYRYQFDPNAKIKETMKTLWQTLVADPVATLNTHFKVIMRDLLQCQVGRVWRERHAASLAIADLIHQCTFSQVNEFLGDIWIGAFRTMDDMNDGVKAAATELCSALTKLAVRLTNPALTALGDAAATLDIILPILLSKGITNPSKDVQNIALQTLLGVTKVAGPNLRPHIAFLVKALLEGLSSMENAALSYLQFHAHQYNMTTEQFEAARLSLAQASPMAEAITSCMLLVDSQSMKEVVGSLCDVLRNGVGLPTLTAAAKFVSNMASSPSLGHVLAPHIKPLLKILHAGLLDRSPTVRSSYATALGYCSRICDRVLLGKVISRLLRMYTKAEVGDETCRMASGASMREVVRYATDRIRDFAVDIAPVAYVAMHDGQEEVAVPWQEVWQEVVKGNAMGAKLYANEIVVMILALFNENSWQLKRTAIICLGKLCEHTEGNLAGHMPEILALILQAVSGRSWDGKEVLFSAITSLAKHLKLQFPSDQVAPLSRAVLVECSRKREKDYRKAAIECLGVLSQTFAIDVFEQAKSELADLFVFEEAAETKTKDTERTEQKSVFQLQAASYKTLGQIWLPKPREATPTQLSAWARTQADNWRWLLDTLLAGLAKGLPWNVRAAILASLQQFVSATLVASEFPVFLTLEDMIPLVDALILCTQDAKYASVRQEALKALIVCVAQSVVPLSTPILGKIKTQMVEQAKDKDGQVLLLVQDLNRLL